MKDAPPPNGIGHFDIVGPDSQALHRFYAAVFGWEVVEQGPGYALVGTPAGTPDGALLEADEASITIGVVVPTSIARWPRPRRAGGRWSCRPPTTAGSSRRWWPTRRATW